MEIKPILSSVINSFTPIRADEVCWEAHDGTDFEIYYWNGSSTIQLTDNGVDDDLEAVNENGLIFWVRQMHDRFC